MNPTTIVRPPAFQYSKRNGRSVLHCEKIAVESLAQKFGTPLYVYSATTIKARYKEFERGFAKWPHTICYSVKANSNLSVLRLLASMGSGFDVVSGGELERVARAAKSALRKVVFSGVGKTAEEMDAALKANILMFNLESAAELHLLAERASKLRRTARVAFRVNPDVKAETHPYISTGLREHKFGVPIDAARELYALAAQHRYLEPAGVSVHIGSQITDVAPFGETMQRVVSLVRDLLSDGLNIRYVDGGGGLGITYHDNSNETLRASIDSYAKALLQQLHGTDLHLLLEPGRSIIAPAGALVTKALYAKQNGRKKFLIVDAAMNDLLRPSLYGAYHEIVAVEENAKSSEEGDGLTAGTADVVGPICETGDFFARDREMPAVNPGELVAILDTGAYGMSLSSNYNTRPRAAEVLVEGKKARLIRRRERVADLLAPEL